MHTAAMKPSYHTVDQVPQEVKDKAIEIQREQTLQKLGEDVPEAKKEKALAGASKSAITKLNKAEVLLEQDLATSDKSETVAQYLKSES